MKSTSCWAIFCLVLLAFTGCPGGQTAIDPNSDANNEGTELNEGGGSTVEATPPEAEAVLVSWEVRISVA